MEKLRLREHLSQCQAGTQIQCLIDSQIPAPPLYHAAVITVCLQAG